MPTGTRLVSNVPVVNTFFEHLEREKPKLHNLIIPMVEGKSTLETIRVIAKLIGYPDEIDEKHRIVDTLNLLWPYIMNCQE